MKKSQRRIQRLKQLLEVYRSNNPGPLCPRDGRDVSTAADRYQILGDELLVHVYCKGWITGVNGRRLEQIQVETNTQIEFPWEDRYHELMRSCSITGSKTDVARAQSFICKLLEDGKNAVILERQLEVAAKKRLGSEARKAVPQPLPRTPPATSCDTADVPISRRSGPNEPTDPQHLPRSSPVVQQIARKSTPVIRTFITTASDARDKGITAGDPSSGQDAPRGPLRIGWNSDDSSSESSDDEDSSGSSTSDSDSEEEHPSAMGKNSSVPPVKKRARVSSVTSLGGL